MAQAALQLSRSRTLGWLTRPSPALRFGLKLGTAMAAAIWIAFAFALPWGLSLWVTVMFVTQPNAGASIKKGLMRIWGSVASALASIALYGLFAQQPLLMLASICGVLALAIYGMTGPRYPYAWLVFGFTSIIILVKALAGSDQIETLSFERASLTALGVLVVFVADALFWPVRAEEQLRESLEERSRRLGNTLKQHLENLGSARAPGEAAPPPSSPLIQQLGLVEQFREEIGVTRARVQAFSRIALLLEGLASRVRLLRQESSTEASPAAPTVRAALAHLSGGLDAALAEVSQCLAENRAPEPFAEALKHSLASFKRERMAQLDARIRQESGGGVGEDGEAEGGALLGSRTAILQDVVLLLRSLEGALLDLVEQAGPANESKGVRATLSARAAAREWFRVDPIRLQLALRAGIAGGGVIVAMLAMGWSLEEDLLAMILAPIVAFILAGMSSTRGAARLIGTGLTAGILLGWLIADLAAVLLFTHLDRMPLSLVYPFAIAGGAGYLIVRGSPLGTLGALFAMLTALLPVFIGDGPPQDVDTSYGLVCGELTGVAAGLIAQRALWPRTAMQTFLERAAAQLDLCARSLPGDQRGSEGSAPDLDPATLFHSYAKQLTLLGQIHAQAQAEPVERALDNRRRAELLALTQDLFDACLLSREIAPRETGPVPQGAEATLASLRAALLEHAEALRSSIAASAEVLRGSAPETGSRLAEAQTALEARLDEVRSHRELTRAAGAQQVGAFLSYVDARRELVARQLAIEAWLADWRRAAAAAA